jgi:hypothetical protein
LIIDHFDDGRPLAILIAQAVVLFVEPKLRQLKGFLARFCHKYPPLIAGGKRNSAPVFFPDAQIASIQPKKPHRPSRPSHTTG